MCAIIYLPIGCMIPQDKLFNVVHNNSDGFGIIFRKDNELELSRGLWMDPEDMYKLLLKEVDKERYVHVRNNTAGETSLDNVHPFYVLDTPERKVLFMHNGTLHKYKPVIRTVYVNGVQVTEGTDAKDSDSKRYVEEFLKPLVSKFHGKEGVGDITDPMLQQLISMSWEANSKGILVASDLDPHFINEKTWTTHDCEDDKEKKWYSSNNSYFSAVTRGPLFEQRKLEEEARKREEAQKAYSFQADKKDVHKLQNIDLTTNTTKKAVDALGKAFRSVDIWETENLVKIANLTNAELEMAQERYPAEFAALVCFMFDRFKETYDENVALKADNALVENQLETVRNKHESASLRIEALTKQLREYTEPSTSGTKVKEAAAA